MTTEHDILESFERIGASAGFVSELQAALGPRYEPVSFAIALQRLVERRAIVVITKGAPDPHLEGADLRIAAAVSGDGGDAQFLAARAAEAKWAAWLRQFFAAHRCS